MKEISSIVLDISIFNKFNFESQPVGVKFMFKKPEGIEKLDDKLALCQMLKAAQHSKKSFYVDMDNQSCGVANLLFGYDIPKQYESGSFGAALGLFEEPRTNQKIYKYIMRMEKGIVNFIAFSPLYKMSFNPDLLIILTDDTDQTEIIMRAMAYTAGIPFTSKMTNVFGCSYIFTYPYLTGKINYITTGLSFGMKQRKVFPAGRHLISIPYNWLPTIVQNLHKISWVLPAYTERGSEAIMQAYIETGLPLPQH